MLKQSYNAILLKLALNQQQLLDLKAKLNPENVCRHSFIIGNKMCPNTTAAAIKEGAAPKNKHEARRFLKKHGITNRQLIPFYFIYDLPAILSKSFFNRSFTTMREAVDELILKS